MLTAEKVGSSLVRVPRCHSRTFRTSRTMRHPRWLPAVCTLGDNRCAGGSAAPEEGGGNHGFIGSTGQSDHCRRVDCQRSGRSPVDTAGRRWAAGCSGPAVARADGILVSTHHHRRTPRASVGRGVAARTESRKAALLGRGWLAVTSTSDRVTARSKLRVAGDVRRVQREQRKQSTSNRGSSDRVGQCPQASTTKQPAGSP